MPFNPIPFIFSLFLPLRSHYNIKLFLCVLCGIGMQSIYGEGKTIYKNQNTGGLFFTSLKFQCNVKVSKHWKCVFYPTPFNRHGGNPQKKKTITWLDLFYVCTYSTYSVCENGRWEREEAHWGRIKGTTKTEFAFFVSKKDYKTTLHALKQ